jgi:hypothetical protein
VLHDETRAYQPFGEAAREIRIVLDQQNADDVPPVASET